MYFWEKQSKSKEFLYHIIIIADDGSCGLPRPLSLQLVQMNIHEDATGS